MEWFGLPKSLAFNRLRVPTETAIKLNDTYLLGCKFDPFTTSLCGAYSLDTLVLADCIGPTLAMVVGFPEDTLVATPEAVASVHSP